MFKRTSSLGDAPQHRAGMPGAGVTRRAFLAGACATGAAAALGGWAARSTEVPPPSSPPVEAPTAVDAVCDADLLIVGAGASGLACAIEAALGGLEPILVEKSAAVGGNARFAEGMFAVNSTMQREQGIDLRPAEVVESELARGQYRQRGDAWRDLVDKSADNIAWCIEQGVTFSDDVNDRGYGLFPTFHRFRDGAKASYVEPLEARLDELGVRLHRAVAATALIMEDGRVVGAYARAGADTVRYDARAVVLATGGFGGDPSLVKARGWTAGDIRVVGSPTATGDGWRLAQAVGARNALDTAACAVLYDVAALPLPDVRAMGSRSFDRCLGIAAGGPVLWIDGEGRRFVREDIGRGDPLLACLPGRGNRENFAVFDQAILERFFVGDAAARGLVDNALASGAARSLRRGDSIEEACGAFGVSSEALRATVARYNELCREGADEDFGKASDLMVPIETRPFYVARLSYCSLFAAGGLVTDGRKRVLDDVGAPIDGLYAIGNDGSMLYDAVYADNLPGAAFGDHVNGGREAAIAAGAYLAAMAEGGGSKVTP